jgi:hypothetical protein
MSRLGEKSRREPPLKPGQGAPKPQASRSAAERRYVIDAMAEQAEAFPYTIDGDAHLRWLEEKAPERIPSDADLAAVTLQPGDFEPRDSAALLHGPAISVEEAIALIEAAGEQPLSERGARLMGLYRERLERRRGER